MIPASIVWTNDDMRALASAIREVGIIPARLEPDFPGELRRLFENAGVRVQYCRATGKTVEELTEFVWDRGFTAERIGCVDMLEVLDEITRPKMRETAIRIAAAPRTRPVVDDAIRKARDVRNRKYVCDHCGQILRGTRSTNVLCGVCWEMAAAALRDDVAAITQNPAMAAAIIAAINGAIPTLRRVDPTPEELLAQSDAVGDLAGAAA